MFEGSSSDSPNTPKNADIPTKSSSSSNTNAKSAKNSNRKDSNSSNLKLTFEQFDLNKDGRISKQELHEVMRNLFPDESIDENDIRDMFKAADLDINGFIDFEGIFSIR